MYTESMALTGKMKFCIICTDFSNSLGIDSMGNPSTGSMYAGWLFNQCPVINQHRCLLKNNSRTNISYFNGNPISCLE